MAHLLFLSLFILTLISEPAPESIGLFQVLIALNVFLIFLYLNFTTKKFSFNKKDRIGFELFLLYFLSLILSILPHLFKESIDFQAIARSLAPYCIFLPIFLFGFSGKLNINSIKNILIAIGIIHSAYLFYLFLTNPFLAESATDYRFSRTTFLDPRTTHPLFFASIFLPISTIVYPHSSKLRKLVNLFFVLFSLFAGLTTQTRSQLVAIILAFCFFVFLYYVVNLRKSVIVTIVNFLKAIFLMSVLTTGFYFVSPQINGIINAILQRNEEVGDNGRNDEIYSALNVYLKSSPLELLLGIGTGTEFSVEEGEDRSYIHNSILYFLVYGGVFGLITMLLLNYYAIKILIKNTRFEKNPISLSFASLLFALFIYVQFFAVHKTLPYNLMFITILAIAIKKKEAVREVDYVWDSRNNIQSV